MKRGISLQKQEKFKEAHGDRYLHSDITVEKVNNDIVNARNVPNINCDKCSREEACEDCNEAEIDEWIAKGYGLPK